MAHDALSVVEILDRRDDLLLPWLDLFETSFPPAEKNLVSLFLQILRDKEQGLGPSQHLLAGLNVQGTLIGMAMYEQHSSPPIGFLWYLAILPSQRSRGWGAALYREVLRLLHPATEALFLEVEIPEDGTTAEAMRTSSAACLAVSPAKQQMWAQRRIQFYRRQGARLLRGIHYMQSVGPHQPPLPMHIMVHPLAPREADFGRRGGRMDAAHAFGLAQAVLKESIQQVGMLELDW